MIPDNLFGPLFILGGCVLIGLNILGTRRGRKEGAFTRYGKLAFAVLMIGFGVLLTIAARGS
jgi:hypothetical protein